MANYLTHGTWLNEQLSTSFLFFLDIYIPLLLWPPINKWCVHAKVGTPERKNSNEMHGENHCTVFCTRTSPNMIDKESSSDIVDVTVVEDLHSYPVSQVPPLTCFCMESKSGTAAGMVSTLWFPTTHSLSMDGESWPLVTDELAEFEKQMVRVQGFRRITRSLSRNRWNIPQIIKKNRKITTCNQFGLGNIRSNVILTNRQTFTR